MIWWLLETLPILFTSGFVVLDGTIGLLAMNPTKIILWMANVLWWT